MDEITLQLSPTFNNKIINLKKNEIRNFSILIVPKKEEVGQKRKMHGEAVDTILIKGLQNYDKYTLLNPPDLSFRSNSLNEKFKQYKGYTYLFVIKNLLFSANFENDTEIIFIICHNLNSAKEALSDGKTNKILGLINLNEIKNWASVKGESLHVNASLTDSYYPEKVDHLAFSFKTKTPTELLDFSCELLNDKAKPIKFAADEKKVLVFDFVISVLK